MTSDPRYNIQPKPQSDPSKLQRAPQSTPQSIDIRRPPVRPLPRNRPVGDNATENMDDMLSYLD
ncbi:MAG: hypothetical protein ACFB5Z_02395 [Elainellaceae cyanobacterium]